MTADPKRWPGGPKILSQDFVGPSPLGTYRKEFAERLGCGEVMSRLQEMVREFAAKHGQEMPEKPTMPSEELGNFRANLIAEELEELREALPLVGRDGHWVHPGTLSEAYVRPLPSRPGDMVAIADALGDLLYVVVGAAVAFGIDIDPVLEEIHRSNMTKDVDPERKGKVSKGPSYEPPDLKTVLEKQSAPGCPRGSCQCGAKR